MLIDNILRLMRERNIKAVQLTSELGIHKSAISEWKNGRLKPSFEAIVKIADYFNVSVDYLIGRTENILASNITNSAVAQGNNSKAINGNEAEKAHTAEEMKLLEIFNMLDAKKRHKLMGVAFELEEEIDM